MSRGPRVTTCPRRDATCPPARPPSSPSRVLIVPGRPSLLLPPLVLLDADEAAQLAVEDGGRRVGPRHDGRRPLQAEVARLEAEGVDDGDPAGGQEEGRRPGLGRRERGEVVDRLGDVGEAVAEVGLVEAGRGRAVGPQRPRVAALGVRGRPRDLLFARAKKVVKK